MGNPSVTWEGALSLRVIERDGALVSQHRAGEGEWQDTGTLTAALSENARLARRVERLEGALDKIRTLAGGHMDYEAVRQQAAAALLRE